MKCKRCDGDGVIIYYDYQYADKEVCPDCDGTGVVEPITNEEYIRNCSTEELAKFLQSVNKYCDYMHNCKKCPTKCKNGGWIGWLKEKHKE